MSYFMTNYRRASGAAAASVAAFALPAPSSDFLFDDGLIYLNTATLGPTPRRSIDAAASELARIASNPHEKYFGSCVDGKNDGEDQLPATDRMDAVRADAATFLGCGVDELCLVPSTTVALNVVANGLVDSRYLRSGRIVTTDQEHPGGESCWRHYESLGVVEEIDRVPVPPRPQTSDEVVAAFEEAVTENTKLIFISHVLTTSGVVLPIVRLSSLARSSGALLVVDGAQAAGSGVDIDLHAMGADVYTVSAHKWLLGPPGSGLLYVRKDVQDLVRASYFDGDNPPSSPSESYGRRPERYLSYTHSTGTVPCHTVIGLGDTLAYIRSFGTANVARHNMHLRNRAHDGLTSLSKNGAPIEILSPSPQSALASPIVSFSLLPRGNGSAAETLARRLRAEQSIVVKYRPHHSIEHPRGNPTWVEAIRLSFHVFNTELHVDRLLVALSELLLPDDK